MVPILVPDPGPGEALVDVRACGAATPTCTTGRALSRRLPVPARPRGRRRVRRSARGSACGPGDFVILNWRAPCGRAGLPSRPALVLLRHRQRRPADDPGDGTPLCPALGIGAFAEKTLVAAGQAVQLDPGRPARGGRADWLRGDGRLGAAINTGGVVPGHGGRHRLRRGWLPPSPGGWPGPGRSSPWTWTTASSSGPGASGPPTPSTPGAPDPVEAIRQPTGG